MPMLKILSTTTQRLTFGAYTFFSLGRKKENAATVASYTISPLRGKSWGTIEIKRRTEMAVINASCEPTAFTVTEDRVLL